MAYLTTRQHETENLVLICSLGPLWTPWGLCAFGLNSGPPLSFCSSFPPLLGALFNEVYQSFLTLPTFFDKMKGPAYVDKKNIEYT
jgi:hypothetical protein